MLCKLTQSRYVAFAAYVAIGLIAIWPFLLMQAPPAYRHDWTWPVTFASLSHYLDSSFSAWVPGGLGAPNLSPPAILPVLTSYILMVAFGLKWSLVLLLFALATVAALGASNAARALTGSTMWSGILAALAYVGLPAFNDTLIAGHLGLLFTWAALPWLVFAIVQGPETKWARPLCVFACAVCTSQFQFVLVAPVVLVVFFLFLPSVHRAVTIALCALAVVLVSCTPLVELNAGSRAGAQVASQRTTLQWEAAQSIPLHQAISATGYEAGYDGVRTGNSILQRASDGALYLLCLLSLLSGIVLFRNRAWRALLVMYAIGVVCLSDLKGPLAPIFSWAYLSVPAATAFRETFHFAPLVVLPLAIATGAFPLAMRAVFRSARYWAPALISATLVVACIGFFGGSARYWLHAFPLRSNALRVPAFIDTLPKGGRAAVLPVRQPAYSVRLDSIGVGPVTEYPLNGHWLMRSYLTPSSELEELAGDLSDNGFLADSKTLYRRMSVYAIVTRPLLRSASRRVSEDKALLQLHADNRRPLPGTLHFERVNARPAVYGDAVPLLVDGGLDRLFDSRVNTRIVAFMRQQPAFVQAQAPYDALGTSAQDRRIAAGCARIVPSAPSLLHAWPSSDWVAADRFGFQDTALDTVLGSAVVTQHYPLPPLRLQAPANGSFLATVIDGSGRSAFRWTKDLPRFGKGQALAVAGRLSVSCNDEVHARPAQGRINVVQWSRLSNVSLKGRLSMIGGNGSLVFTDAYNDGWQLSIDGKPVNHARHFIADGALNGWDLTLPVGPHVFELFYEPARLFDALTVVASLAWLSSFLYLTVALLGPIVQGKAQRAYADER